MSHTSQRRGLDDSRPAQELIVLAMIPAQYRDMDGINGAMSELGLKMLQYDPDNWISRNFMELQIPRLAPLQKLLRSSEDQRAEKISTSLMSMVSSMSPVITAVYTGTRKVEQLIADIKGDWLARNREKGYPISIILSGLTDDIHRCCQHTGLREHTYLNSLGFFGKVQDLPSEEELSLITMCGHGLIAVRRVRALVRSIRDKELTPEQAGEELARPCVCGIVNRKRATEIFSRLALGQRQRNEAEPRR